MIFWQEKPNLVQTLRLFLEYSDGSRQKIYVSEQYKINLVSFLDRLKLFRSCQNRRKTPPPRIEKKPMQRGFLKLQKTRLGLPTFAVICCLILSLSDGSECSPPLPVWDFPDGQIGKLQE